MGEYVCSFLSFSNFEVVCTAWLTYLLAITHQLFPTEEVWGGGTSSGKNSCGKNSVPDFGTIFSGVFKDWDRIFPGQLKDC